MMQRLLRRFARRWRGPALLVRYPGGEVVLGQGRARTSVTLRSRALVWRLLVAPSLTFGEAYAAGTITVEGELPDVLQGYFQGRAAPQLPGVALLARGWQQLPRPISVRQAVVNARAHYDVSNDFYELWLDPALVYSCACFLTPRDTLAQAQQQKLELLCRKVRLQPGQSLLDIGCGWGGLLFHAAQHYQAQVTGITPAKQQAAFIRQESKRLGLANQVRVLVGDWRQLAGAYDRVVSVGMFEHVGQAQYARFFTRWRALLAPQGISLLHTIGRMEPAADNPWIRRYIFPGGHLPTLDEITARVTNSQLLVADVENLWQHYVLTLRHWSANFAAARAAVVRQYGEAFARRWWLYLQGSEAAFRWGGLQLWQLVLLPGKSSPWPLNREVGIGAKRAGEASPGDKSPLRLPQAVVGRLVGKHFQEQGREFV